MVLQCQNKEISMYSIIREWLINIIEDGSWKSYNSIHIDDIDSKYEEDSNWYKGGIECLNIANSILDELSISKSKVFLLYSLLDEDKEIGINFNNTLEFSSQFDGIPPSLYVYEEEWNGFKETIKEGVLIKDSILNVEYLSYHIEYKEDGDNEYRRSVMILKE